jgi:hypothetical protein
METMGDTMNKKSVLHYAVTAALLAMSGIGYAGTVVDEVENNGWIQTSQSVSAQPLVVGSDGSITVHAALSAKGDVDYFSFQGTAGDTVSVDIDRAWKGAVEGIGSVDTLLALFGPNPTSTFGNYYRWLQRDDHMTGFPLDAESLSSRDTFFQFTLPYTGTYTVGVTYNGNSFNFGGSLNAGSTSKWHTGPYELVISGVTPLMTRVNIDVKPGQTKDSRLNPKSRGVIPVAILSKEGFKPMEVDPTSLGFGASGDEPSLQGCHKQGKDLNGDGVPDLVCNFDNEKANFEVGETVGTMKGKAAGKMFEGYGDLKVFPENNHKE